MRDSKLMVGKDDKSQARAYGVLNVAGVHLR